MLAFVTSAIVVRVLAPPPESGVRAASEATPAATALPVRSVAVEQAGLQQLLNQFVGGQHDGQFAIVVQDLHTGATASIDPDRSMESASLYKLFVAEQIYHMIDAKTLSYSTATGGGSNATIGTCLNRMITLSDNTCGLVLGNLLDWGEQNPALNAQGFTETDLTTPQQTSARDVATLFERLYDNTLDSPDSNTAFLGLLKNQLINDRLPQGLPAGTVIAHKTGNLDNMVHDAGIVYGLRADYVVVVMSGPWAQPGNAPAQFASLSQQLWQYIEQ